MNIQQFINNSITFFILIFFSVNLYAENNIDILFKKLLETTKIENKEKILKRILQLDENNYKALRDLAFIYFKKNDIKLSDYYLKKAKKIKQSLIKKQKNPLKNIKTLQKNVNLIETNKSNYIKKDASLKTLYKDMHTIKNIISDDNYTKKETNLVIDIENSKEYRQKTNKSNFDLDNSVIFFSDDKYKVPVKLKQKKKKTYIEKKVYKNVVPSRKKQVEKEVRKQIEPVRNTEIPLPPIYQNQPVFIKNYSLKSKKNRYDLNSITKEELGKIKGLTEVDAELILTYKEQFGKFNEVAELLNIPGLNLKYTLIKDYFYVDKNKLYKSEIEQTPVPVNYLLGKVNINTADLFELKTRLKLTTQEAQMIIDYRKKFGNFKKKEDFKKIYIIGSKYKILKDSITIK